MANTQQPERAFDNAELFEPLDDDTMYYLDVKQAPEAATEEPQTESVVTSKQVVYLPMVSR